MPFLATSADRAFRVLLLRHGQSHANVQGLVASSPANALDAFGLTASGQEQVRRSVTAALASGVLPAGARVISSPLLRARESATIAAEVLGSTVHIDVHIDARLTERAFGDFELGADDNYEQVWQADRADPSHVRWGVESVESVHRRATALIREFETTQGTGAHAYVLCTHGDVASVLLCADGGLPLSRHREVGAMGNGELRALRGARDGVVTETGLSGRVRER